MINTNTQWPSKQHHDDQHKLAAQSAPQTQTGNDPDQQHNWQHGHSRLFPCNTAKQNLQDARVQRNYVCAWSSSSVPSQLPHLSGEAPPPDSFELPCRRQETNVRVRVLVIPKLMIRVIYLRCRLHQQSSEERTARSDMKLRNVYHFVSEENGGEGGNRAEWNGDVAPGRYISSRTGLNFINR